MVYNYRPGGEDYVGFVPNEIPSLTIYARGVASISPAERYQWARSPCRPCRNRHSSYGHHTVCLPGICEMFTLTTKAPTPPLSAISRLVRHAGVAVVLFLCPKLQGTQHINNFNPALLWPLSTLLTFWSSRKIKSSETIQVVSWFIGNWIHRFPRTLYIHWN